MDAPRKPFDAVAMMRKLRDQLDRELAELHSYEEERRWLDSRDVKDERLRRLLDRARDPDPPRS